MYIDLIFFNLQRKTRGPLPLIGHLITSWTVIRTVQMAVRWMVGAKDKDMLLIVLYLL